MGIRAVEIFNLKWAHHDLLKEKTLSAVQYSVIKSKSNQRILASSKTYKTKLSFKTICSLNFRKCNRKRPSCPLSTGLDFAGFYERLKFVSLSAAI